MPNKENVKRPIFIVSGGKGVAGHTMVQSLIIQYPDNKVPVNIIPNVQNREKIEEVVRKVKTNNGLLCHTMVNGKLRKILVDACKKHEVDHIDFMGPLADFLENELGLKSVNVPGLYRRINAQYFDRIEAIEFAMNHDDGLNHDRLKKAEIVLIGVSRSGKTPLSVYMSMYGWKVANIPIVLGIDPPPELFQIDPQRVFALKISPQSLIAQRHKRLAQMNNLSNSEYIDSIAVNREIRNFNLIIERGGFSTVNVTNKPIETSANEIIGMVSERFGSDFPHESPVS
ncbi:pyruvate, water dikinase regulatory protein [Saccharicrinis sp. FJH54]|uniref:pyruvate, water dikinase regulatory protein n=1 Tax=Saccharicrinis sp. FJH54 TaxID=3344665 RepID=UPI0035D47D38